MTKFVFEMKDVQILGVKAEKFTNKEGKENTYHRLMVLKDMETTKVQIPDNMVDKAKELKPGKDAVLLVSVAQYNNMPGFYFIFEGIKA